MQHLLTVLYKQRPVSSLLSHFENLSHTRSPSAVTVNAPESSSSLLKSPEPADDPRASRGASLDLSRPRSPWAVPAPQADLQQDNHANGDSPRLNSSLSFGRRHARPMSMNLRNSPQLGPTLTVDSPKSPPRAFEESMVENQNDGVRVSRSPSSEPPESSPPRPSRGPVAYRPTTPNSTVSVPPEPKGGHLSPGELHSARFSARDSLSDRKSKSASLPPPANRAEKPKIPAKPANLSHQEASANTSTSTLAPRSKRASSDLRVSPFSTPPSSPEKPPSARPQRSSQFGPLSRSGTDPPPAQRLFEERFPGPSSTPSRDARELGFTRRRPTPDWEPSRDTKPLAVQIPQRPSETTPTVPQSAQRLQAASDSPNDRPGLPPRRASVQMQGRLGGRSPSRQHSNADFSSHSVSSPKQVEPVQVQYQQPPPQPPPQPSPQPPQRPSELRAPPLNRQPSFSRENKPVYHSSYPERQPAYPERRPSYPKQQPSYPKPQPPAQPLQHQPRIRSDPEEEEEQYPSQPNITLTDYPDASNANRRPPVIKGGPTEIPTRYDTRLMDVCGKHVCTTGYLTRVWDLTNGEQIMSLSHGETVKTLSLAFKPGTGLEDEGNRVWLGTNTGELHEVDIPTRSIVTTRSYPSRREVVKILRHKKEMWTMDDEGRLLVWPPDETGAPNLQYSYHNPYDRVARGQTFSMVVGDELWLATGKEVHVYRPNARDDTSFKVLRRPLGAQHTGDVTSGAYTTKNGGRVYLGHADGKISVYSATDYSCLTMVNVSVYKISCLSIVGNYLWAGYKTGMIYVYDVNSNPWTVKKDWRAHDEPVSGFILDTSSVWTMNRLQVTSLGMDNHIRLWDGTLESDWLGTYSFYLFVSLEQCCLTETESRMQARDVEFCDFREIRAVVMTWNAGASTPGSARTSTFIQDAIHPEDPPEILVFGFQELVDLENKKITASSYPLLSVLYS